MEKGLITKEEILLSENNKRDRGPGPLSPETAEIQDLQLEESGEGGDDRTPSFMTNETEKDIASSLALYGLDADIRTFSPLALAFLGDAVFSLIIRTSVLARGNRQAEKLHNETTRLVRAGKQAAIGRVIYDILTTEEKKVYRRGRNSHPMHHAKGASLEEYLQATALETLCGYLYLQGRTDRLMELLRTGLELTQRRNGDPLL